jgi:phage virion morphogenesis protein
MAGLRTEIKGKEATLATLGKAVTAMEEPKPLFDLIGAALVLSTQMRFENETDPDGNPWPQSFRARTEGGKTLRDSALLFQSVTHEPSNEGVAVGVGGDAGIYAAIQHFGGTITAKTSKGLRFRVGGNGAWVTKMSVDIPAHPYLGVNADDEKGIIALSEDYLFTAFGEAGGDHAHR